MTPWTLQRLINALPSKGHNSPVEWCEKHVRLIGSARQEKFHSSLTPWTTQVINDACSGQCSHVTFVKPVQSGGSVSGECALCYWIGTESGGDIQNNWENDSKAIARFDKRIEKILKKCGPVMLRAPDQSRTTGKWKKGEIIFPHLNLTIQGVWQPDNLDSDTIRFQVNEEIHNWEPGRLAKAYNRTTAVWNSVTLNISNAGNKGDQLHQALLNGTDQRWEVKCPGCGEFHDMRTRWEDDKPELGGLRYDSDGCRTPEGDYDYNKLSGTIFFQMPCGYTLKDEPRARRDLSLSGRYGPARNLGALATERSYSLEAVSVDYIPWLKLIKEKHEALRALRRGDPEPWIRYLQERECRFWDPEDRPVVGKIIVSQKIFKRDGLPNRVVRFGALDYQAGTMAAGELAHWWAVIRDVDAEGNSRLVFEGKLLTDEDAADVMKRHEVEPTCVVADSGHDATHVYRFCLKHGFSAIKGSGEASFAHEGSGRKIFSPEKPLHTMLNLPKTEHPYEPLFWIYSKTGIRERLKWLRSATEIRWEVPQDVSKDYRAHMESEEDRERKHPRTGETIIEWVQVKKRNDLYVCECYIAMLMEMAGLLGAGTVAK